MMEFEIERASLLGTAREKPPCEGAERRTIVGHRPDGSSFERQTWIIDIKDIVAFAAAIGESIVLDTTSEPPCITIYDDYIE
jgi:hypothetical protein